MTTNDQNGWQQAITAYDQHGCRRCGGSDEVAPVVQGPPLELVCRDCLVPGDIIVGETYGGSGPPPVTDIAAMRAMLAAMRTKPTRTEH